MEPAEHVKVLSRLIPAYTRYLVGVGQKAWWATDELTPSVLLNHLRGTVRVGALANPTTNHLVFDFDGKNKESGTSGAWEDLLAVQTVTSSLGLGDGLIELTRSGLGYHQWFLFDKAIPTTEVKRLGLHILSLAELPTDEDEENGHPGVYPHPAQEKGTGKSAYLPWCGLLAGSQTSILINQEQRVPEDQLAHFTAHQTIPSEMVLAQATLAPPLEELLIPAYEREATKESRHKELRGLSMSLANRKLDDLPAAWQEVKGKAVDLGLFSEGRGPEVHRLFTSAVVKRAKEIVGEVVNARETSAIKKGRFEILGMDSIFSTFEEKKDWIVEPFVETEEISLIAAPPAAGKSFVSLALAVSIASGTPSWGKLVTPKRRKVLYLNEEMDRGEYQKRIRRLANGTGVKPEDLTGYLNPVPRQSIQLNNKSDRNKASLERLKRTMDETEAEIVFIDTFRAYYGGDEKKEEEIRDWFDLVASYLKDAYRASVVLQHHLKKPDKEFRWNSDAAKDPTTLLYMIRGSGDLGGVVDKAMVMWKPGNDIENDFGYEFRVENRMCKARKGGVMQPFTLHFNDVSLEATTVNYTTTKGPKLISWEKKVVDILEVNGGKLSSVSLKRNLASADTDDARSTAYRWMRRVASECGSVKTDREHNTYWLSVDYKDLMG